MKTIILSLLATVLFTITSCSEKKENATEHQTMSNEHDMNTMNNEEMNENEMKIMKSPKDTKTDFTELYQHYQHLIGALANDDDKEASNGATGILEALAKINNSGLTEEQAKEYADLKADIKEHAEHIKDNIGNIEHQREHLDLLSKDFYDLAKDFGTKKTLYKIHCPMYNDNKGAFWISTTKEIKNPYYGQEMISCGEVQEEIK